MSNQHPTIRALLRTAVTTAMRERQRDRLAALRSALGAIDNAEAVPLPDDQRAGAIEAASVGVGSSEAARRELTEDEMRGIVEREAAELAEAGRASDAAALRELLSQRSA